MKQISFSLKKGHILSDDQIRELQTVYENGGQPFQSGVFHIYSGVPDKETLSAIMHQLLIAFPQIPVVGTESGGEINGGKLAKKGILVSALFFVSTRISVQIFDNLKGHEREIGIAARNTLDGSLDADLKAAETLLPGALLNTMDMFDELKKCDRSIRIFGGYAGNHDADLANAFVMANGQFYHDALVLVLYCGKKFHIDAAKSAGWQKLGRTLKITSAEGNLLREIDGMPAADAYKKYLNIRQDADFVDNTNEFPIMALVGGEELLRHTNETYEDGSLLLAGSVMQGWDIYLTFGNPTSIIITVNERLKRVHAFRPEAILLYSCYVRKLFWDQFVNVEMEPFQKIAPSSGFHTFGEVLRNMENGEIMEYNITLLSIAMREGDAEQSAEEAPQADMSILSGQASIISRLAQLVSSSMEELQASYNSVQKANEKLRYMAEHDTLTGLYNRGRIEEIIKEILDRTREEEQETSLVMFDIDHFKSINDHYGHQTGDIVLKSLSELTTGMLDPSAGDSAGRWGGEEFFIVLPGRNRQAGALFAEQLRAAVEQHAFPDIARLTISVGVMTVSGYEDVNKVYRRIDDALYQAKDRGRNMVVEV